MVYTKPFQRVNAGFNYIGCTVLIEKPGIKILVISREAGVIKFSDLFVGLIKSHGNDAVKA